MTQIFNKPVYKERRQALRRSMTEPEKRLWSLLRQQQLGYKFRRQHGIGHYIVDFYCPECKLVIEVDGASHSSAEAQAYDAVRDAFMQALGITTLRLNNAEVMENPQGVYQCIVATLNRIAS